MASKRTKVNRSRKGSGKNRVRDVDVVKLEELVADCLESQYKQPWYRPDNIKSVPHWDEIVDSFYGGYDLALGAVLKALRGDGGQALQDMLSGDVMITRPVDRAERDAKLKRGALFMHFGSRDEANDFLKAIGIE